jgi:hypothetical protein
MELEFQKSFQPLRFMRTLPAQAVAPILRSMGPSRPVAAPRAEERKGGGGGGGGLPPVC